MEFIPVVDPNDTEVWNCENAFEFICPRKWASLKPTRSNGIRYCEVCDQNVYLCETPTGFVRQGELGRCVAIREEVTAGQIFSECLGTPSKEQIYQMRQNKERAKQWWEAVVGLNPRFNSKQIEGIGKGLERLK